MCHALRGGRLDHEHHETREKHEPAGAAMYPAIPRLAGDIASGRAEDFTFSQKNSQREFFCEKRHKSTMLPPANRASI